MNKCLCCGADFTPVRSYGQPQVYCSKKCANRVRNERVKQRIIQSVLNEKTNQNVPGASSQPGELSSLGQQSKSGVYYGGGGAGVPVSNRGVDSSFFVEHLEKVYEQKFQTQVMAFQFEQQLKAMQQNNELIAARLKEMEEEGDDEEGDDNPGSWIAGIERLLENDRFMGLAQLGLGALQGKKVTQ